MKNPVKLNMAIFTVLLMTLSTSLTAACRTTGLQLQVLGSGGPGDSAGRASSAYLLWLDGRSRILIDAGGGSKNLFHQSGANLQDLDLIALSHFHPDHSAELPAILWPGGGDFTLAGPGAGAVYPSVGQYAQGLFGADGVFAILEGRVNYSVIEASADLTRVTPIWNSDGLNVSATGVPHADVPTLGYRVDYGDHSIAFTSDQNGSSDQFIDFIRGVDYLVIHLATGENPEGLVAELHARPSVWGQMAARAGIGQVVVSHISTSDADQLAQNLSILSNHYAGPVTVSEDLMCIDVD